MAKPITLITWEPFLIQQEVSKRMNAFRTKFNPESIFVFAEHPLDVSQIIQTINGGWGLFATKSCIFIHGLPLASDDKKSAKEKESIDQFTEWFCTHYATINTDTVIVFVSPNPDKRGKLYKLFDKAWSDSNLGMISRSASPSAALDLVTQQLSQCCSPTQCQYIVELIATSDLYRVRYETSKIIDYIAYNQLDKITNDQLSQIITPHVDQDSFAVIDSVIYKSPEETLALIDRLQQVDDSPYSFLWLLYRGLRGVIMTVDAMNHGITNSSQLMSLTKLPPFTIGRITKNYNSIKNHLPWLTSLFHSLIEIEYGIKTGRTPVEMFRPTVKTIITQKSK